MPLHVYAQSDTDPQEGSDIEPFFWLLIIVGSCIIVVLLYVGWKKYRAEVKKERVKQQDKNGSD
ncbi:MAG TPA: sporulation protein YpjB [Virgibacillus sp.]|nr:sporulation protein YpjB [Virgibacillus sp.]